MMAKSMDLRERVVWLVVEEKLSRRKAAERLMIGVSTAIRIMQRHDETGDISPYPNGGSISPLEPHMEAIRRMVDEDEDISLDELRLLIRERLGVETSVSSVHRALDRLDLRLKKKAWSRRSRRAPTSR